MTDIALAALRIDRSVFGPSGNDRMRDLSLLTGQAAAFLERLCPSGPGSLKILLAPEYFFSEFAVYGQRVNGASATALTRSEKHEIYAELKALSARYPDILLFAGSILYTRSRFLRGTEGLNVCPVLYRGKIIFKMYKRADDKILGENDAAAVYASKGGSNAFSVGGLNIGLEICADHGDLQRFGHGNLDLQVLLSAGSSLSTNKVAVRNGGIVAHCDLNGGLPTAVQVIQWSGTPRPGTRVPAQTPNIVSTTSVGGVKIECYALRV